MPVDGSVVPFEEAVAMAHRWHADNPAPTSADRLVVIGDGVDSTNAGSPGDSNWILGELLR